MPRPNVHRAAADHHGTAAIDREPIAQDHAVRPAADGAAHHAHDNERATSQHRRHARAHARVAGREAEHAAMDERLAGDAASGATVANVDSRDLSEVYHQHVTLGPLTRSNIERHVHRHQKHKHGVGPASAINVGPNDPSHDEYRPPNADAMVSAPLPESFGTAVGVPPRKHPAWPPGHASAPGAADIGLESAPGLRANAKVKPHVADSGADGERAPSQRSQHGHHRKRTANHGPNTHTGDTAHALFDMSGPITHGGHHRWRTPNSDERGPSEAPDEGSPTAGAVSAIAPTAVPAIPAATVTAAAPSSEVHGRENNKADPQASVSITDTWNPHRLNRLSIKYRKGKWTQEEKKVLLGNIDRYIAEHNVTDIRRVIFGPRGQLSRPHFWRAAAAGLDRPLLSVYRHTVRIFDELNHKGTYTPEEDQRLRELCVMYGNKWTVIGQQMNRSGSSVRDRARMIMRDFSKGSWTPEEERRLAQLVARYENRAASGARNGTAIPWKRISEALGSRSAKQCQTKWTDSLAVYSSQRAAGQEAAPHDAPLAGAPVQAGPGHLSASVQCDSGEGRPLTAGRKWWHADDIKLVELVSAYRATDESEISWKRLAVQWGRWSGHILNNHWRRLRLRATNAGKATSLSEMLSYLHEVYRATDPAVALRAPSGPYVT